MSRVASGVRELSLDRLRESERNPRRISAARLEQLKRSLEADREMLRARPVVALPDGAVLMGNMRLRAARELGWKTLPVLTVDLDDERAALWMLRDNQGYGEWDEPLLAELLAELDEASVDSATPTTTTRTSRSVRLPARARAPRPRQARRIPLVRRPRPVERVRGAEAEAVERASDDEAGRTDRRPPRELV